MDEYIVEIDELDDDIVVVVAPALSLPVFGRTLDEALYQARVDRVSPARARPGA